VKALLILLALAGVAHADDTAKVDKLVREALGHFMQSESFDPLMRDDAVFIVETNKIDVELGTQRAEPIPITKVTSVAVRVDHHAAWFRAEVYFDLQHDQQGDGCPTPMKWCGALHYSHISGLAIDDSGWKIAALFRSDVDEASEWRSKDEPDEKSETKSDQALATGGDMDVYQPVVDWMTKGALAAGAAPHAIFQGVEKASVGLDANAKTLAAAFDKTKARPLRLIGKQLSSNYGVVYGVVISPTGIKLRVLVITVKHGDTTTWVVADFS
jgi:hypothetical protein